MKTKPTIFKKGNFIAFCLVSTLMTSCLVSKLMASCSKNNIGPNNEQPGSGNATVQNVVNVPTTVNLQLGYRYDRSFPFRLVLPITKIGNKTVNIKSMFDTGSEGLILMANRVIPSNLVTVDGINLNGKDQMDVNGITITSTKAHANYGLGANTRSYQGQVAYASIVIGDENGHAVTRSMPFLLVYKGVIDPDLDGICGVGSPKSPSTQDTSKSNRRSPFAYINYGNNVIPGFKLQAYKAFFNDALPGQTTAGNLNLSNAPILQVGLTADTEQGFTLQHKPVGNDGQSVSGLVSGKLAFDGNSFTAQILFDTGTPKGFNIAMPDNLGINQAQLLNDQTKVSFTTDEGYNYNYLTNQSTDQAAWRTKINPSPKPGRSILGLQFFATNSFLIDFTNHIIGLKHQ